MAEDKNEEKIIKMNLKSLIIIDLEQYVFLKFNN